MTKSIDGLPDFEPAGPTHPYLHETVTRVLRAGGPRSIAEAWGIFHYLGLRPDMKPRYELWCKALGFRPGFGIAREKAADRQGRDDRR
jgi:hypothetical protein